MATSAGEIVLANDQIQSLVPLQTPVNTGTNTGVVLSMSAPKPLQTPSNVPNTSSTSIVNDDSAFNSVNTNTTSNISNNQRVDTSSSQNSVQGQVDQMYGDSSVTARPNVLDNYISYTYNVSLYMMSAQDQQRVAQSGSFSSIPSSRLLIHSGGNPSSSKNKYFQNDYFIEQISLKNQITGPTGSRSTSDVRIVVTEPNGITFIGNLAKAALDIGDQPGESIVGPSSINYLLKITFNGYDNNGNITKIKGDDNTVIEKFYPIQVQKITFKLANKVATYEINAVGLSMAATTQSHGSVPYQFEVSAMTVNDALLGPASMTSSTDPTSGREASNTTSAAASAPNAPPANAGGSSMAKQTIRQGLIEAINNNQKDLVKQGIYEVADQYSVTFLSSAISSAKVLVKDGTNKGTPMPTNASAAGKVDPNKQSVDNSSRLISFTAGSQLIHVIDEIIRNSTYIMDQSKIQVSEKTGKYVPSTSSGKNTAWYKISTQSVPIKWDKKRNQYAYKFNYIISPYKINNITSPYFTNPNVKGIHKRYDYWFTGKNTQVIDLEHEYNNMYLTYMTAYLEKGTNNSPIDSSVVGIEGKKAFSPRSGQSSQGASGKTNEISANAADYLYDQQGSQNMTLTIIGDPAWLIQDEASVLEMKNLNSGPFHPNGTINSDYGQVLFEILFNTPQDYDLDKGIMDLSARGTLYSTNGSAGKTEQSYVFTALEVQSDFHYGKFTQQLKGKISQYYPDQSVKEQQLSNNGLSNLGGITNIPSSPSSNEPIRET